MNGATQTFRRPSVATNTPAHRDSSLPASASTPVGGAYIPPHMSSNTSSIARNGDSRYSKDELLELYKSQRDVGSLNRNVEEYFVADWDPHTVSAPANGAWGKRDDHKNGSAGPEVCWDHAGQVEPLGLTGMTEDEREVRLKLFFGVFAKKFYPPSLSVRASAKTKTLPDVRRLGQFPSEATPYQRRKGKRSSRNRWSQIFHLLPPGPYQ